MKRGVLILILVLVLIFAILALIGGYIYMQFTREPDIPDQAVLVLPVEGRLNDVETSPISQGLTVRDIFYHLQRAKMDDRIQGLLLKVSWIQAGPALTEDLGLMIRDFRKSGKPVHAFLEGGGLNEYMLASYCNSVTVMPGADLFLKHYASEALFLRRTLDKLGIQAEFYHLGRYKTAASLYTRDSMSAAHRESLTTLLDDVTASTIRTIAENRSLDPDAVRRLIDALPLANEIYRKEGLIDRIGYADELFNSDESRPKRLAFSRYARTSRPNPFHGSSQIALLFASGEIHQGSSGGQSMFGNPMLGSDTLAAQINSLRRRKSVKAVVLRLDSPGGSAVASEAIRHALERLAAEKPVVVSMAGLAASGGYWLSTAAPRLIALPATLTGSIGVLGGKFINRGFYDKIGVSKELVEAGNFGGMFSDIRAFSPAERERFQALLQRTYKRFVSLVANSRHLSPAAAEATARGRVWSGSRAKKLGLVDECGGLLDALAAARKMAGIKSDQPTGLLILPPRKSLLDLVLGLAGVSAREPMRITALLRRYDHFFPAAILPFQLRFQ